MRTSLVLCLAVIGGALGAYTPALIIKWGINVLDSSAQHYEMPLTVDDAVSAGWVLTERDSNAQYSSFSMYCMENDVTVCMLYDSVNNYIAGLQVAISVSDLSDLSYSFPDVGFQTWTTTVDGETKEFYTTSQYFVSSEYPDAPTSGEVLRAGAVYLPDLNNNLMEISEDYTKVSETDFTTQACIPTMGEHFYYKMTTTTSCATELLPWFTMYDDGQLVGTGFMMFATIPEVTSDKRNWFEDPTQSDVEMIVPSAPDCFYELAGTPGAVTMHVFYVSNPSSIGLNVNCII